MPGTWDMSHTGHVPTGNVPSWCNMSQTDDSYAALEGHDPAAWDMSHTATLGPVMKEHVPVLCHMFHASGSGSLLDMSPTGGTCPNLGTHAILMGHVPILGHMPY